MKTKRFNLGVKIASILSAVAILSVGFASWLIVNVPEDDLQQVGSFTVHQVVDNSVSFAYDWGNDDTSSDDQADGTINFGTATKTAQYNWFRPDSNVGAEKLSAEVAVAITNYKNLDSFSVRIALPEGYSDLVGANLITNPTVKLYAKDGTTDLNATSGANNTVTVSGVSSMAADVTDGNVCTIVVKIEFAWGSYFTVGGNVVNPINFYNNSAYSASLATDAVTKLNGTESVRGIYNTLNGASYDLYFTGAAATN